EEVVTRAFDARVTAMFYKFLPSSVPTADSSKIDNWISKLNRDNFLMKVEDIRQRLFTFAEQSPQGDHIDFEYANHAKFLQLTETYKTLKFAIKHADVGLIKRAIARCCIYFQGSRQSKYAFLSLYMTRLT